MFTTLLITAALTIGQNGDNGDDKSPAAPEPDRYLLMKLLEGTGLGSCFEKQRLSISGWTDASFTASSDRHVNLPMGFNYRANEPLLQQNWLRFERTVDTSGSEASFGFRSDTILPGSDYRFTLPRGIWNSQLTASNGEPSRLGVDPIQFYLEGYFPNIGQGLDVKVGRFFAQFGVEANDAPGNQLASHAYTFIYDPFTNTGMVGTLKLTKTWSVQAGIVLGSDVFIDPADSPTFIGSVKWAPPEGKDTVQVSVILGSGRYNQEQEFNNPEVLDLVWTHKINQRLTYTLEALYEFQWNTPQTGFADSLGMINYLTYEFSSKVSGTTRLEFYDDFQGQRTGYEGLYTALTAGLQCRPCKSLIFRPELRYDYNGDSRPFENHHGLFTATADMILRW